MLAYAGKILADTAMIASAEKEARAFYSRLLINGMMKEMDCAAPQTRVDYDQIAYGIRPMTLGLLRLYDATGNDLYLKMAGLAASWLFGNNVLHQVMYDSTTGICYDGISDSSRVNKNSGAESTIEALFTLLEIDQYPLAKKFIQYRIIDRTENAGVTTGVFQHASGNTVSLVLNTQTATLAIHEGKDAR